MERMQLVDVPGVRLSFAASFFFINLAINQPVLSVFDGDKGTGCYLPTNLIAAKAGRNHLNE
jgi:hypothetical protein